MHPTDLQEGTTMSEISERKIRYTAFRFVGIGLFDGYDFEASKILPKLSTVNILVGANNSGKSRFLRSVFQSKNFGYWTNFFDGHEFRNFLREPKNQLADEELLARCAHFEFDPA